MMWKLGLRQFPEKEYINGIAVAVHTLKKIKNKNKK
jgi:hypothetical protein